MIEKIGSTLWKYLSRFILFCLNLLLKIVGKKLTPEQEQAFLQFCKFALVGVSNTLLSGAINALTLILLGKADLLQSYHMDVYCANVVAFLLSVLWSYYWNNRYVFTEKEGEPKRVWWKTLLRTYVAYAFTGLILANLMSYIMVDRLGINKFLAIILNLFIAVPINFLINKFWAYGEKKTKNDPSSSEKTETHPERSIEKTTEDTTEESTKMS